MHFVNAYELPSPNAGELSVLFKKIAERMVFSRRPMNVLIIYVISLKNIIK